MFAILAALAFGIGVVMQAVNGPDLGHNYPFWLLAGLTCWTIAVAWPALPVRRGPQ